MTFTVRRGRSRVGVASVGLIVAVALIAGCGDGGGRSAETVTVTASSSESGAAVSKQPGAAGSESLPSSGSVSAAHRDVPLGSVQLIANESFTARVTVGPTLSKTRVRATGATVVGVSVSIDVQRGQLTPGPVNWQLITEGGRSFTADLHTTATFPNAIGDTPIQRHSAGVLVFLDSANELSDDVKFAAVDMVAISPSADIRRLARWVASPPIAVGTVPPTDVETHLS